MSSNQEKEVGNAREAHQSKWRVDGYLLASFQMWETSFIGNISTPYIWRPRIKSSLILWCLPASTLLLSNWWHQQLHPSGHMDPDQVPALELLSRAASSVGTEGTIPIRKGPNTWSLAPGIRQRVKKNKKKINKNKIFFTFVWKYRSYSRDPGQK